MLINSMVGIFSQCLHLLNHHTEPFIYITILFVNYTSVMKKRGTKNSMFKTSNLLETI